MIQKVLLAVPGLLIAACAFGGDTVRSKDTKGVIGKFWHWEETITPNGKITVPDPDRHTMFLTEAGNLQARFDCNRGGGDYKISEGELSFSPLISIWAACPPSSLEGLFMKDLRWWCPSLSRTGISIRCFRLMATLCVFGRLPRHHRAG